MLNLTYNVGILILSKLLASQQNRGSRFAGQISFLFYFIHTNMPETNAFKAYLEEMAKNGKIPGKNKKDGKLAVELDELSREENVISDSMSDGSQEDTVI